MSVNRAPKSGFAAEAQRKVSGKAKLMTKLQKIHLNFE